MNQPSHRYQDLISLFNQCFEQEFQTRLVKGGDEPIYLPTTAERPFNELHFAHGFFASALHECAHWLIAGEERRKRVDFGYWYRPDGRSAKEQALFEKVEIKPQALEWIFSVAANHTFNISADNLSADIGASEEFVQSVEKQAQTWCLSPMPERAALLVEGLSKIFGTSPLELAHYQMTISVNTKALD